LCKKGERGTEKIGILRNGKKRGDFIKFDKLWGERGGGTKKRITVGTVYLRGRTGRQTETGCGEFRTKERSHSRCQVLKRMQKRTRRHERIRKKKLFARGASSTGEGQESSVERKRKTWVRAMGGKGGKRKDEN